MGYLIDTNILSELRKKEKANPNAILWFDSINGADCFISVLTVGEIVNGIKRLEQKDQESAKYLQIWLDKLFVDFVDRVLPITNSIAIKWGGDKLRKSIAGDRRPDSIDRDSS